MSTRYIPDKTCLHCGAPIPWRDGPAVRVRATFCCAPCMHAYNAAHPLNTREGARQTKACEICGTEFSYYPTVRRNAKYCSQECKGIGHSATMTGRRPSLGVYTSCATFRAMARVEFLDRCAVCGWDEAPNDVCHIIARRDGGSDTLENVVMLCPNHHRLFDRGQIAIDRIRAARANCVP